MTKVTEIELIPIKAKAGLTFFANCVLDNKFFVGNIAIFTKLDGSGFRCVYPTKVLRNGKQVPIFYPLDKQTGQEIADAITVDANKLLLPEGEDQNG